MEDREIVGLYMERKEDALRETQRKYHKYLLKVAYNILGDRQDSEECVNDTYLSAWSSIPQQKPQDLSTYLSKITRQKAIDIYRMQNSQKRRQSQYALSLEELSECFSNGTTPEETMEGKALGDAISAFLRSLPTDNRNAFISRYFYFDSMKEVARNCGIRESKLKTILYRTRQALRDYLIKEGFIL